MAITQKVSFTIYNKETVSQLRKKSSDVLPSYTTDNKQDLAYNKKQVKAAITSAVIQGKSIDGIADDLQTRLTTLNQSGAIKTARTAVTSAQNSGTLASMKELAAMGIEVQKEWVATLDDRTRPSHRALDGQRRDLDKAFSNGLQYPGDSSGNATEVWNCRCTMVSYIPEYDSNDEPRLTYEEWEKYKLATGDSSKKITESQYNKALDYSKAQVQKSNVHTGTYEDSIFGEVEYEYDEETGLLKIITEEGTIEYDLANGKLTYSVGSYAEESELDKNGYNNWLKKLGLANEVNEPKSFYTGEETNNWFYGQEEYQRWANGLTQTNTQDILNYTGSAYVPLNNTLRKYGIESFSSEMIEKQLAYAARMDEAIGNYDLPEAVTLLRGMTKGQLEYMLGVTGSTADVDNPSSLVGCICGDEGFGSYTPVQNTTAGITNAKECSFFVTTSTGKGVGAYINQYSLFEDDEYEFLLARNVEFEITEAYTDGKKLIVKANMKSK